MAEGPPQDGRLLDETPQRAARKGRAARRPAAPAHAGDVIVELQGGVGPFLLVWFIADGEIETRKSALDRVPEKLAQVDRTGTIAGQLAVVVARQHMVVAVAKREAEIGGHQGRSDRQAADMDQAGRIRIGCEIEKEFARSRPRED